MKHWLISLAILIPALAGAELYKWTDEKGNVHFSDKPLDDKAEAYDPPPLPVVPAGPAMDVKVPPEKKAPVKYKSVTITSPENDAVFFPDNSTVRVGVEIDPRLDNSAGHQIAIYVDGKEVRRGLSSSHVIRKLERGSHSASAAIVDEKGKVVKKSNTVTFHVKKHHL